MKEPGKSILGRGKENFISLRQKVLACLGTREEINVAKIEWPPGKALLEEAGESGRGERALVALIWIKIEVQ